VIAAPPPVSLTATPAQVALAGAAVQSITVANPGRSVAVVEARPAGFALDLHGRPHVVVQRDRSIVLSIAPRRFALAPGAVGTVLVASTVHHGARVGDHVGLVLFTTQPRGGAGVGVRMQVGVPVTVRVPGAIRHRIVLESMRLATRVLELRLHNTGNVTVTVGAHRFRVELRRSGHVLATIHVRRRELLPGARSVVEVRLPRRIHGRVGALVIADDGAGGMLRRAFAVSRRPRDR
jgi:translation initiation factor IF-1